MQCIYNRPTIRTTKLVNFGDISPLVINTDISNFCLQDSQLMWQS